jgi:hypothetical protein
LPLNFLRRAARLFPARPPWSMARGAIPIMSWEARVHRLANALLHMGVAQG